MRSPSRTHDRAKALRQTLTLPERLLWVRLRKRDPDTPTFRRQHPVAPYILDFFCTEAALCIEVDGYGHTLEAQWAHDERRTTFLRRRGIEVMRFPAKDVLADPDEIAHQIVETARRRIAAPSAPSVGCADTSPASGEGA